MTAPSYIIYDYHFFISIFYSHKRTVHPKISDLKLCHICDHKAVTNQNLHDHIESVHGTNIKYPCNFCDEIQSTRRNLSNHIRGNCKMKRKVEIRVKSVQDSRGAAAFV